MGGECSKNGVKGNTRRLLVAQSQKEDVGGWIILRWILER
jgi:hypothetical protein